MDKSIRVRVLDREFGLRVRAESEADTREIAAHVDARMRAFKRRHPEQPELTVAIFTALALAEELYSSREQHDRLLDDTDLLFDELDQQLASAMNMVEPMPTAEDVAAEPAELEPPSRTN